uniref:Ciliary microtubule inner protein 6 n=1 Tax=Leptobrachium leishanense TaxID=445787 RepID=A0A8C5M8Q4_9ANUR
MYPRADTFIQRRMRVPARYLPNTFRVFDENLYDVRQRDVPQSFTSRQPEKPHVPRSPFRNNVPHPYFANFIRDNVRFLAEPISHMETACTKHKQTEWWPTDAEKASSLSQPPYDKATTQRIDFIPMTHSSPPTRHGCNPHKSPQHGIVPLAYPKSSTKLPKILLEQMSFNHQYNSRATPSEPIRGKRHGALVWTEIKTEARPDVPQGTRLFPNVTGSHLIQQPETQKGNSAESSMTSPNLGMHGSQQMFNSKSHLSKTDFREASTSISRAPCSQRSPARSTQAASVGQACVKNVALAQ